MPTHAQESAGEVLLLVGKMFVARVQLEKRKGARAGSLIGRFYRSDADFHTCINVTCDNVDIHHRLGFCHLAIPSVIDACTQGYDACDGGYDANSNIGPNIEHRMIMREVVLSRLCYLPAFRFRIPIPQSKLSML